MNKLYTEAQTKLAQLDFEHQALLTLFDGENYETFSELLRSHTSACNALISCKAVDKVGKEFVLNRLGYAMVALARKNSLVMAHYQNLRDEFNL